MFKATTVAWIVGFSSCLALITLVTCTPVEIVYTGEGCDCPTKLDYQVNVPKAPKPKVYKPSEYGYKVDVPVQTKAKVSYSFDFTVEEPKTAKPPKAPKWDLYAKVDRIAINKGDCPDTYEQPSAPGCSCGQCGVTKPLYRYVYKKMKPCKCKQPKCQCNRKRSFVVDAIQVPAGVQQDMGNNIRRKRDLQRTFYRPRPLDTGRPGRFVKLYHTNLDQKSQGFLDWVDPHSRKEKRKAKQTLFSRLVKRDIKGEYDLIEEDRKKLDLTLPEIIQYMPETLQPDFKQRQCYFGCSACGQQDQRQQQEQREQWEQRDQRDQLADAAQTARDDGPQPGSDSAEKQQASAEDRNDANRLDYRQLSPSENAVADADTSSSATTSTYTKRNAMSYDYDPPMKTRDSAYAMPRKEPLPLFNRENVYAYNAEQQKPLAQKSTNPIRGKQLPQKSGYSAISAQRALSPEYVYDQIGQKYLEKDGYGSIRVIAATASVPDPTGGHAAPLQYAGDIDTPSFRYRSLVTAPDNDEIVSSRHYPVQQISNDQLDKIIAEIVYRHPDFVDATTHYNGALIDPEPWQQHETKDFLKKLLEGRLDLWFGHDDDHADSNPYPSPSPSPYPYHSYDYTPSPYRPQRPQNPFTTPKIHSALPILF